jgi:hypothetical protein
MTTAADFVQSRAAPWASQAFITSFSPAVGMERSMSGSRIICELGSSSIALAEDHNSSKKRSVPSSLRRAICVTAGGDLTREQLKNWRREWKIQLIEEENLD